MKRKMLSLLTLAALLLATSPSAEAGTGDDEFNMVADAAVVRPLCFAATIVGSAIFVVSLPVTSLTRSVHKSARTFVVRPAKATFTRPFGDMEALRN